uniref:Neurotransmitter-gated ion-channel ligand-binding domain-containing protein n=1 Tax=Setaria digitata TaxID=48799 RepID=A0A915PTF6_9BILA
MTPIDLCVLFNTFNFQDDRNQIIGINAWLQYRWNDYRLVWNSSEYKQIDSIRFGSNMIWHPDILLYNSGDENFDSTYKSQILVYSNGDVIWIPPGTFRTSCRIDITWFPFDDQSCYLKKDVGEFAMFDLMRLNGLILGNSIDLSDYTSSGEWTIKNTRAKREEIYYSCCPDPYYSVKFFLSIRRRTLYYGFNIIIPSLLIATLTTLAFTLPPIDLSEKIGFQSKKFPGPFGKTTLGLETSILMFLSLLWYQFKVKYPKSTKLLQVCVIFLNSMSKILRMERMDCGSKMIFIENKKFKQQASRSPILQLERCKALKHALLKAEFESDCLTILASKMPEIPASHLFISEKIGERLSTDSQHLKIEQKKAVTHEKLIKLCMEKLANPGLLEIRCSGVGPLLSSRFFSFDNNYHNRDICFCSTFS